MWVGGHYYKGVGAATTWLQPTDDIENSDPVMPNVLVIQQRWKSELLCECPNFKCWIKILINIMWASQLSVAPKKLNDQQKKSQLEIRKNLIFLSLVYIITAIIMTNIMRFCF